MALKHWKSNVFDPFAQRLATAHGGGTAQLDAVRALFVANNLATVNFPDMGVHAVQGT